MGGARPRVSASTADHISRRVTTQLSCQQSPHALGRHWKWSDAFDSRIYEVIVFRVLHLLLLCTCLPYISLSGEVIFPSLLGSSIPLSSRVIVEYIYKTARYLTW